MVVWASLAAAAVAVFLCWNLSRRFGADRLAALSEKRRPTSRIVGRGQFFDGNRHLDVAMALTTSTLFYENADMEASLDLQFVREIEYDTSLSTGLAVVGGKVLRLRCYSQVFEFVIPNESAPNWHTMLPPHAAAV